MNVLSQCIVLLNKDSLSLGMIPYIWDFLFESMLVFRAQCLS